MSEEYIPGAVQFSRELPVNNSFLEEIEEIILPSQANEWKGQIDFHIPAKDLFTATKFLLHSVVAIRKVDEASGAESRITAADDKVAPVPVMNLLAYKAMTLTINGETVERYNDNTCYKSYLKFIGGHTSDSLSNMKYMTFFYPDSPEEIITTRAMTAAWKQRNALVIGQDPALENFLPFDISACPKLLPPNTELRITLHHQQDAWRLQTETAVNAPYIFKVTNPRLVIWRYILSKEKIENFRSCFSIERPLTYQFPAMDIYGPFPIAANSATLTQRIRYGKRPICIHLFFVNALAATGFYNTNALYLQNLGITESQATFGSRTVPEQGLKTNFSPLTNNGVLDICDAYRTFLRSLGLYGTGQSSFMTAEHFVHGYTFLTYKFTPNFYSTKFRQPQIDSFADLSVSLKIGAPPKDIIHMYCAVVEDRSLIVRPNNTAELKI